MNTMKAQPRIETERLDLRPFDLSDAADVQQLANDPRIADVTQNIPHPYEDGMAEEWISTHQSAYESGKRVQFAIQLKSTCEFLGCISLNDIEEKHQAEIGYWIGAPYWNRGYCTEAGKAVLEYAFTQLALIRIHSHHLSRNPGSGRVMRKLGMEWEGCRRKHVRKSGRFEDIEMYGILKNDWEAAKGRL